MARITRPLTNNEILKAKPGEKVFTLHYGDGQFLLVQTSGKKTLALPLSTSGNKAADNDGAWCLPRPIAC